MAQSENGNDKDFVLSSDYQSQDAMESAKAVQKAETAPKSEATEAAPAVKKEPSGKTHTVKQGDTLYRISRRYNLSVEQLRQYNKLDPKASIYPGQKLKVTSPK